MSNAHFFDSYCHGSAALYFLCKDRVSVLVDGSMKKVRLSKHDLQREREREREREKKEPTRKTSRGGS